ncbi:MAG TPA: glucose-1-phosphate adenylyltransferase, partial [Herpetosiphonaceae bacterium]|nr:glucose-1-phosphate adenylyltransferase [Herpetosiphonaceae bacterium]
IIEAGARVERCILDKQVIVGRDAIVGYGDDLTPNKKEPGNLASGITIIGKGAQIPAGTRIGRNCRIDADVRQEHFDGQEVVSGETISPVKA